MLTRSRFLLLSLVACSSLLTLAARADKQPERFGPYLALTRDASIVADVKVTEEGFIYILLNPEHKEKEIILKNSSGYKTAYRQWFNGELELVSPADQDKAPNEYTDWVKTTGNYIEYYMNGELILHLAKASVHQKPSS